MISPRFTALRRVRRTAALLLPLLVALPLLLTGCIERWLFVKSEPSGARIFVDSVDVGVTPNRIPFDHYGTREILLRFEGEEGEVEAYQSMVQIVRLRAPWYQWFPVDLFVESLWPWTVVDEHSVEFTLEPADLDQLYDELQKQGAERGMDLGDS